MATLPNIRYTSRDFATILTDLRRHITATKPGEITSFFEGDVASSLMEMLAYTGDILSFAIDRTGEEAFTVTARTRDAMLRHASGVSYPVATSTGASATLVPSSYESIPDEVCTRSAANAVQRVTLSGTPTGGTFTLSFDGEVSSAIPYNATSVQVQTALESVTTIGSGNVLVTGDDGGPWLVTFTGDRGYAAQDLLVIDTTLTTRNEVKRITITGTPSGSFKLIFTPPGGSAETTGNIAYNAPSTGSGSVQEASEALPSIDSGDVSVTGSAGGPWTIEFTGQYASTDIPGMSADTTLLVSASLASQGITDGNAVTGTVATTTAGYDNTYSITFTKGTQFEASGFTWEVATDTTIDGIDVTEDNYTDVFRVPVHEGSSWSNSFTSTGRRFQSYTTTNKAVIGESIEVRVGGPDSDAWTLVETLALSDATDTSYTMRFTADGAATILFGDGVTGAAPAENELIYIAGRTGGGESGNVGPLSILSSISGTASRSGFPDLELSVPLTNPDSASGGRDEETTEEMRRNIPAYIRTVDKALTKEDYDTLAGSFESTNGSIGRASSHLEAATVLYQLPASEGGGAPITEANPLVVPAGTQITIGGRTFVTSRELTTTQTYPLLWINPNLVMVYVWSISDRGFGPSSDALISDARTYLQERSVVTTTIVVIAGSKKTIDINLGEVTYSEIYTVSQISDAITAAAIAFFKSDSVQPGVPFRLSDFYAAIEAVAGVEHFVIVSPTADVTADRNEIPYLGTLSFTLTPVTPTTDEDPDRPVLGSKIYP